MDKDKTSESIDKWLDKVEKHLVEYVYFSSSEAYLFEASNLIRQLTGETN